MILFGLLISCGAAFLAILLVGHRSERMRDEAAAMIAADPGADLARWAAEHTARPLNPDELSQVSKAARLAASRLDSRHKKAVCDATEGRMDQDSSRFAEGLLWAIHKAKWKAEQPGNGQD